MNALIKVLAETLTPTVVIIVCVIIIRHDLTSLSKDVNYIKEKCDERLKWCLDHFKSQSK